MGGGRRGRQITYTGTTGSPSWTGDGEGLRPHIEADSLFCGSTCRYWARPRRDGRILWLSDESDITCIRVHTSEGVLHDPERPEVGRRRIRVGSTFSELLQAYGLGADDVIYLPSDRFGPTFVLRGVQGLRFGVAGEIEYDEDGNHEKDKLLGERLVSIAVQRGNVHDVLLSMLGY